MATTLQDLSALLNENDKDRQDTHTYGQVVGINEKVVGHDHTGQEIKKIYYEVSIAGGGSTVECAKLSGASVGDTVMVTIMKNGYAVVTGTVGGDFDAARALSEAKKGSEFISELASNKITTKELIANHAYINDLEAHSITADSLVASTGYIGNLMAENITAEDIAADHASITNLDTEYAKINLANISQAVITDAWINKLMVQTGLIAHEGTVFTLDAIKVDAANITAGTIDVQRLVVTDSSTGQKYMLHVNSDGTPSYEKLDGNIIEDLTITADKIVAGAVTAEKITTENIVGSGGWINLRNGTFQYVNATTNNGISWDGKKLTILADSIKIGNSTIQQLIDNSAYTITAKEESKGGQLVINGSASLGDNTNFSSMTYVGSEKTGGAGGSFTATGNKVLKSADNLIPVNTSKCYEMSFDVKSKNAKGTFYAGLILYDIDKQEISAPHQMFMPNTTTTLAQDLKNGDKVVYLTDLTNWNVNTETRTYQRGFIFWNYKDSTGYQYPAETYSRNFWNNLYTDANVNKTAKTITLISAWDKGTIPKGTAVSQSHSGSGFMYLLGLANVTAPTTWTHKSGLISGEKTGGGDVSGANNEGGVAKFRPGTVYVRPAFILNNNSSSGEQFWLTNISLRESDADKYATKAELKVTSDSISSEVSKKVGATEIISKINQSAESVKIQASKVEIDGTATFNAIKSSLDNAYDAKGAAAAKKSIHNLTSSYNQPYSTLIGWAEEGKNAGNWTVSSTAGVNVGDTVRIKCTVSDMNQAAVYVIGTVTTVGSATVLQMTSHGIDTTVIDGGKILTGSITADRLNGNVLTIGNITNLQTTLDGKATTSAVATAQTTANSAKSQLEIKDTRNDNQNPAWYITNYPRQEVKEFKYAKTLGLSTGNSYGILVTSIPWVDSSGGYPKQVFYWNDRRYHRDGTSDTAWSTWIDDGTTATNYISASSSGIRIASANPATQNQRLELTSSNAKFYDANGTQRVDINASSGVTVGKTDAGRAVITDAGMTVYNANNTVGSVVNANGMTVYKNGTQVASFGDNVTFYIGGKQSMVVKSNGFVLYDNAGANNGQWTFGTNSVGSLLGSAQVGYIRTNWVNAEDVTSTNKMNAKVLQTSGNITCNGALYLGGSVHVTGAKGLYSETMSGWLCRLFDVNSKHYTALGNNSYGTRIYGSSVWSNKSISTSDERMKMDIEPLDNAKDFLMSLDTFSYKWDKESDLWDEEDSTDDLRHFGVSAQDVMAKMKEHDMEPDDYALTDSTGTYYGVVYSDFIPLLIRTVQDQQKEIDELKERLDRLEAML